MGRGDYAGAALSAAAMIPFAGWGATAGKFGRTAANAADAVRLKKSLASIDQVGQPGAIMAGQGERVPFRDAPRIANDYGGNASDWVKKTGTSYKAPDGISFETHWVENLTSGQRVECKTKLR